MHASSLTKFTMASELQGRCTKSYWELKRNLGDMPTLVRPPAKNIYTYIYIYPFCCGKQRDPKKAKTKNKELVDVGRGAKTSQFLAVQFSDWIPQEAQMYKMFPNNNHAMSTLVGCLLFGTNQQSHARRSFLRLPVFGFKGKPKGTHHFGGTKSIRQTMHTSNRLIKIDLLAVGMPKELVELTQELRLRHLTAPQSSKGPERIALSKSTSLRVLALNHPNHQKMLRFRQGSA